MDASARSRLATRPPPACSRSMSRSSSVVRSSCSSRTFRSSRLLASANTWAGAMTARASHWKWRRTSCAATRCTRSWWWFGDITERKHKDQELREHSHAFVKSPRDPRLFLRRRCETGHSLYVSLHSNAFSAARTRSTPRCHGRPSRGGHADDHTTRSPRRRRVAARAPFDLTYRILWPGSERSLHPVTRLLVPGQRASRAFCAT